MKRIAILIFTLLLAVPALRAQRVGVVFSGGGSKGLYHIGILKALEENRIPVDYVAGTSMGAIVAGLYAVGYTPDEMAELFLSDRVRLWMTGQIERRYAYYFNRMKIRQEMVSLDLDFRAKKSIAILPTNLVPSTQIDLAFDEIFAAATAASGGDFDRLFVPFRSVAADVYGKKETVFREGDVGEAIRASMSIPLVFSPMRIDSVLYFDGGIFNNFPWQTLEEDFAPDVYIGGKCIREIVDPDEGNLVDLIEALTMSHTDFDLPVGRSVLVDRVFDDVSVIDFSRARQIMQAGYDDAIEQMDSIRALIPRRQDPDALHERRLQFRSALPELVFDDYLIDGLTADQARYVRRMLGLDEQEYRTFDFEQFKSAYFKILSGGEIRGGFPKMRYRDSTGYFTVRLPLRTRPELRVKIGGNISSTQFQQAYFGLEYKAIAKRAHTLYFDSNFSALYTSLRGGWRTDFYLGMPVYYELGINYNDYNYRRGPNWSTFEKFGYRGYGDTYATTSLGVPIGRNSALQARLNVGSNTYHYYEREYIPRAEGSDDRTKFNFWGLQLELSSRTLNHAMFPTRGIEQHFSAIWVNGRERFLPGENYVPLDAGGNEIPGEEAAAVENPFPDEAHRRWVGARYTRQQFVPVNKWLTMGYLVDAVFTTRPDFYTDHATNFVSPGFTPTPYSRSLYMDKFRSPYFVGAGLMPVLEFDDNFYLKSRLYLYASDKLMEHGLRITDRLRHIFESSLVYQTPVGPASLTVTNYEEASRKWFVAFNFGFTLFNNRGLFY